MIGVKNILDEADKKTNPEILVSLRKAAELMAKKKRDDFWTSDEGQAELLRMITARAKPPERQYKKSLFGLDYTTESKAMLCSASAASQEEEQCFEIEMTADTGGCDTVMPKDMAKHIMIQPSLQSLRPMEYEVANGAAIPNLGERRCLMWTENAAMPRKINIQVADVHKALLSLSRCADMGFESRFGRLAGALICEETGEVIPLERKENLYVLKCWVKSAPFGRQDHA